MESYSPNAQYKSITFILDVFSSDIFEIITWIRRPVVGAADYLRSMRRLYTVQNELNQILNVDYETRERLLNALTEIVSINIYEEDIDEIEKKLEDKISELKDFDESFKKLKIFTAKLDAYQQFEIFRLSLIKLNGRISSIREEIKSKIWDKKENTGQLLVLDQMFFLIQELIKEAIKNPEKVELWTRTAISLLKLEAFHRGKITFDDLQDYISELSILTLRAESIPKNYNAIFEVLEA
ncbi:MAG: hypothetical protein MPEBLZ_02333 [Candidatus Methanoperedens nitroreducens]|uniref:Uncharacterized protein n=1 Tax=Candidatus Methanoperedens nitratireducens TaxID=1392998 RepID=A0A0P8CJJ8_9EURY|nr:MAG: hypothetical protein MPEBLZ_02333 [Candidatus Methanoperedens sp. BLZ1]MCX9080252.1 hypothetical protein [Candidatus Methanoperedens sp.]CAG0995501.1 hypothetical protein METP2_02887 [Methanosarcinales archaeon]